MKSHCSFILQWTLPRAIRPEETAKTKKNCHSSHLPRRRRQEQQIHIFCWANVRQQEQELFFRQYKAWDDGFELTKPSTDQDCNQHQHLAKTKRKANGQKIQGCPAHKLKENNEAPLVEEDGLLARAPQQKTSAAARRHRLQWGPWRNKQRAS